MCYLSYLHKCSIPYLQPMPFPPEMEERCAGVGRRTKQMLHETNVLQQKGFSFKRIRLEQCED